MGGRGGGGGGIQTRVRGWVVLQHNAHGLAVSLAAGGREGARRGAIIVVYSVVLILILISGNGVSFVF